VKKKSSGKNTQNRRVERKPKKKETKLITTSHDAAGKKNLGKEKTKQGDCVKTTCPAIYV